ncbi:MAG: septum formation family protein [Acidimicrobiia bacterium]
MRPTTPTGRLWGVAVALGLIAACGGPGSAEDTTTTSSSATTSTTSTTTTTTTTTLPPTTTTTLPPVIPVVGWDIEGVRTVSVEIEFNYPEHSAELHSVVDRALRQIGLTPGRDADAELSFDLEGTGISAQYTNVGRCYTGARLRGTAHLTAGGLPDLRASIDGNMPTPGLIYEHECGSDAVDAPFDDAFDVALIGAMTALFGPASVPHLSEVVSRFYDGDPSRTAIEAYRRLDYDAIPIFRQYEFLDAVLGSLVGAVQYPTSDAYIRVARSVLLDYSPTDFGFSDAQDLEAWGSWLVGWAAEQATSTDATNVRGLRVGDCLNDRPFSKTSVVKVSCADPHDREVYFAFDLADGPYPGEFALEEAAWGRCLDVFDLLFGSGSELWVGLLTPTEATWALGDRTVHCAVGGDERTVGSVLSGDD